MSDVLKTALFDLIEWVIVLMLWCHIVAVFLQLCCKIC